MTDSILKNKPAADSVFLGVLLPREVSDFLSVYAVTFGTPKSSIVRSLVVDWFEGRTYDPEELASRIADKVHKDYNERKKPSKKPPKLKVYTAKLEKELHKKGINKKIIKLIIKEFHEKNNED